MTAQNKEVLEGLYHVAFNQDNVSLLPQIYAQDFVGKDPALAEGFQGAESVAQAHMAYRASHPNHQYEILSMTAEDDIVVVHWRAFSMSGLNGAPLEIEGMTKNQFQNGKIIRCWQHWDNLGLAQKLGTINVADI